MGVAVAEVETQVILSQEVLECLQSLKDALTTVGKYEGHLLKWTDKMIKKISSFEEKDYVTDRDKTYFLAELYGEIEGRKKNKQIDDGHFFDLMEGMSNIEHAM